MNLFKIKILGFSKILIEISNQDYFNINDLIITNNNNFLPIVNFSKTNENSFVLFLKENINIKYYTYITYKGVTLKALYKDLFSTNEFNNKFYYDGELGLFYYENYSTFKLWSPASSSVSVLIYESGDPSISEVPKEYPMHEDNGVWKITINDNLKNLFYTYKINVYNNTNEVVDPYAKAVGINGLRGAIIDLKETNPIDFDKDIYYTFYHNTDAIIYEISIRDISSHTTSTAINKGKFLALTENSNCLNHIKDLGITHVQIMPCFDFSYTCLDEKKPSKNYNWGYNPQNYNVPEGSYSSNPYDPKCRIIEIKKMIQHLHNNNILVNMDVVYNHLFHKSENIFEKIFPGYYFRLNDYGEFSDGSGCGNDTASEHKMMRKFIIDSLLYWVKEYHIDGFRFDLMGIHDVDTIKSIYNTLKNFNKHIMLYGEGWDLNTLLDKNLKATEKNAEALPGIGFFNETIRDTIKGNVFSQNDRGFVSGKKGLENILKYCITACCFSNESIEKRYVTPEQSINYVSCHDNYTLWDKLQFSNKNDSVNDRKYMVKLSNGIILTSQGVPFLHSGVEFCRTKNGSENSFNSGDIINSLNYNRKTEFIDVYEYHRGLIKLRKEHPAFRMYSTEDIKNHLEFLSNPADNTIGFIIKNHANNDAWNTILVIYNPNKYDVTFNIPYSTWYKVVNKYKVSTTTPLETIVGDTINVESISMVVMYSKK
ncbi:type I pullulanase [Clostridium sp. MB40-C1]|uniref:type I pullulanase n=1 Tax=Clostridium sp. MB40-C1 TaxID=3070996 RepID=UPI0027DF7ED6|nr:type I pullulanase [Clostridium sp. MB40-C1]WMJ79588.1 type I pullulanase [Clostridium sp. MB40-C1]